ncbi:hypothetical protein SDC9_186925 [bioreactor metagenome]|uniref:Uncharacterized protein n=1 Tax=bioreactor metagenome TaxID=1076179 RepID=A0A645HK81_9ZZZZ
MLRRDVGGWFDRDRFLGGCRIGSGRADLGVVCLGQPGGAAPIRQGGSDHQGDSHHKNDGDDHGRAHAVNSRRTRCAGGPHCAARPHIEDLSAQPELGAAGRPGAPTLHGEDLLGDLDLLGLRRQVRGRSIGAAAEGQPGGIAELDATVVTVAGVDRPVAARLAHGQRIPGAGRHG